MNDLSASRCNYVVSFFFFYSVEVQSCLCDRAGIHLQGYSFCVDAEDDVQREIGGGGGGGGVERLFGSLRLAAVQFHGKYC